MLLNSLQYIQLQKRQINVEEKEVKGRTDTANFKSLHTWLEGCIQAEGHKEQI